MFHAAVRQNHPVLARVVGSGCTVQKPVVLGRDSCACFTFRSCWNLSGAFINDQLLGELTAQFFDAKMSPVKLCEERVYEPVQQDRMLHKLLKNVFNCCSHDEMVTQGTGWSIFNVVANVTTNNSVTLAPQIQP